VGIQRIAASNKPAPKATCPRCRRPVAVLRSGRCSYCGAVLDPSRPAAEIPSHPEALIALDPRAVSERSPRMVWIRRLMALGAASALAGLFARACMRS